MGGVIPLPRLTGAFLYNLLSELPLLAAPSSGVLLGDAKSSVEALHALEVKVRGHRVELGEVEAALRGMDGVRDAIAVLHGQGLC